MEYRGWMGVLDREEKSILQNQPAEIMFTKFLLRKLDFITKVGKKIILDHLIGQRPNLGFCKK